MKFWTAPQHFFNYALHEVTGVFYERYPNSYAKHIISEDVIDRVITKDQIITRKLIVKKGRIFWNFSIFKNLIFFRQQFPECRSIMDEQTHISQIHAHNRGERLRSANKDSFHLHKECFLQGNSGVGREMRLYSYCKLV